MKKISFLLLLLFTVQTSLAYSVEVEKTTTVESIATQSVQGENIIAPYLVTGEALVQLMQQMADFNIPGAKIVFNRKTAQLFIKNTPSNHEVVETVLNDLRKAANRQVEIEARIITISSTDINDLGLNSLSLVGSADKDGLTWGTGTVTKSTGVETSSTFIDLASSTGTDTGQLSFSVLATDVSLDALINAYKTRAEVNTLSAPRLIVSNNQRANIKIEKAQYFVRALESDSDGSAVATDPEIGIAQSGTILDVTPTINSDGTLSLELHPTFVTADLSNTQEISVSDDLAQQPEITLPIFNVQQADTTVTIENGGVAAIAGLIEEAEKKTFSKIPLLGDIPLIGKMCFSSSIQQQIKTHLVIFVKATVRDGKKSYLGSS